MTVVQWSSLRNSAPVTGAMKGTPASAATGTATTVVGVPTEPISAKTSCSSIRLSVLANALAGS